MSLSSKNPTTSPVLQVLLSIAMIVAFVPLAASAAGGKDKPAKTAAAPAKTADAKKAKKRTMASMSVEEWSDLMDRAKAGDPASIRTVLESGRGLSGFRAAEYGLQVANLYKVQVKLTIAGNRFLHGGNDNCLLWWIVPVTEEIDFAKEVIAPLDEQMRKQADADLKAFRGAAVSYRAALRQRTSPNYTGCRFR